MNFKANSTISVYFIGSSASSSANQTLDAHNIIFFVWIMVLALEFSHLWFVSGLNPVGLMVLWK